LQTDHVNYLYLQAIKGIDKLDVRDRTRAREREREREGGEENERKKENKRNFNKVYKQ